MPLLRKRPFVRRKPPSDLQPTDKVFYCQVTGEVFTQYEEFWERLVLCNSMVWSCELTGRPNLTFSEAVDSETRARRCLANVPQELRQPTLYLASLTRRGRYVDLSEDVFTYVRDRYFVGEEVEAIVHKHWYDCKVTGIIPPTPEEVQKYLKEVEETDEDTEEKTKEEEGDDEVEIIKEVLKGEDFEEKKKKKEEVKTEDNPPFATFKYKVVEIEPWDYKERKTHIVGWDQIRRNKGVFTREKCKLFLKQYMQLCSSGFWVIKDKTASLYNLSSMKFSDIFPGPPPKFRETKAKKMPLDLNPDRMVEKKKREKKEAREKGEGGGGGDGKRRGRPPLTNEQKEARRKIMREAREAKEEMTAEMRELLKQKLEKEKEEKREERQKEREIKKEEKRIKLQYIKEWNRVIDDQECDDHKDLPQPNPVSCSIPDQEFGNFMAVLEFVNIFCEQLELNDVFSQGITFEMLEASLLEKEVAGPLNDLLQLLLQALFTLQEGEDDEVKEDTTADQGPVKEAGSDRSLKEAVLIANRTSVWTQQHHGSPLQKLQLDALTLTEVLRLHLLASGATNGANARWRHFNRGGYKNHDDPGLHFKLEESALLKRLAYCTVFDLSIGDKLKILTILMSQILTYASLRDTIDENMDQLKKVKHTLKSHQLSHGRHERELHAARLQEKRDRRQKEREKLLKAAERKDDPKQDGDAFQPSLTEEKKEEEEEEEVVEEEDEEGEKPEEEEAEREARLQREAKNNEARRQDFLKREAELIQQVLSAGRGVSTAPLGQDRAFRRYWVFSSVPGLFVEDWEPSPGPCRPTILPHHPDSLAKMLQEQKETIRAQALQNLGYTVDSTPAGSDKENAGPVPPRPSNLTHLAGRPLHPTSVLSNGVQATPKTDAWMELKEEIGAEARVESGVEAKAAPVFGLCTADPENCPVHAPSPTRHRWYFFHRPEHLQDLLATLNPRGHRERHLKAALTALSPSLQTSIRACPVNSLDPNQAAIQEAEGEVGLRKSQRQANAAVAAYSKKDTNLNFPPGTPVEEVVRCTLTDMILETEEKLHVGMLGNVQTQNREDWRERLLLGTAPVHTDMDYGGKRRIAELKTELGQDMGEPQKQEEEGEGTSDAVRQLRLAILQLARAVDPKYLQPPLGETDRARRTREKLEETYRKKRRKEDEASSEGEGEEEEEEEEERKDFSNLITPLEHWESSLIASTGLSQLCLHFATLDNSVSWAQSVANTRCRVCRRKTDPESILLCDGCNKGTHLYCLKPKLKEVPDGDWFCDRCRPKERPKSPRKKRQIYREESEDEDSSDDEEDEEEEEEEEDEQQDSDICCMCSTSGELISCDTCRLSFHQECAALRKVPRGSWTCQECITTRKGKENSDEKKKNVKEVNKGNKDGSKTKNSNKASTPRGTSKATTPKGTTPKGTPKSSAIKGSPKGQKNSPSPTGDKRKRRSEGEGARATKRSKTDNSDSPPRRMSGRRSLVDEGCALNMGALTTLLDELQRHPDSCHFNKPVSKKQAPDYYNVVRKPMDLGRVRDKLSSFKYSSDGEFLADVMLVFQNCQQYNLEETPEYRAGALLSDLFLTRVSELRLPLPHGSPALTNKRRRR